MDILYILTFIVRSRLINNNEKVFRWNKKERTFTDFASIIISQCSRQETNTISPEGLPMSNIAVYC